MLVFDTDLNERNRIHCYYLMALGNLGPTNGHTSQAVAFFDKILAMDVNHQGAGVHRNMADFLNAQEVVD